MTKTNAARLLESIGIPYDLIEYDTADGLIDGVSVAQKTGRPAETVLKTLVAEGGGGLFVFVVPVGCTLDLKKAARAAGVKAVQMLKQRDLEPRTGYVHGGCSPVGMKKQLPTFIEESAQLYGRVVVSAGRVGLQMELAPIDLARAAGAAFCDLV